LSWSFFFVFITIHYLVIMYYYNVMLYITCKPKTNYSYVYMCILLTKSMFIEVFTNIILYLLIHHFRVFLSSTSFRITWTDHLFTEFACLWFYKTLNHYVTKNQKCFLYNVSLYFLSFPTEPITRYLFIFHLYVSFMVET